MKNSLEKNEWTNENKINFSKYLDKIFSGQTPNLNNESTPKNNLVLNHSIMTEKF